VAQTHLAQRRARQARKESKKEIGSLSKRDIFIMGVSLYWAEGYKRPVIRNGKVRTSHIVSLTNSDPNLIKSFLRFLREICLVDEEKIIANLRIFEHQNEAYLLDFWSKATNIDINRFRKTYVGPSISSKGKRPFNILPYGTLQIGIGNTNLYHKIMGWIDGLNNW